MVIRIYPLLALVLSSIDVIIAPIFAVATSVLLIFKLVADCVAKLLNFIELAPGLLLTWLKSITYENSKDTPPKLP